MGSWKWILIRIPLIFLQYLHFQNGCYEIFMALKQCYFYLRGHTHFLGSLELGYLGPCVPFQRRLLLLQFSVDRERHASCLLFVCACCVCMLALYACLLCMHSWSCVCMLALYTGLLHTQTYCVCMVTVYVQMLCMHAWSYVRMLEGEEFQDPFPCSLWCGGGALGRAVHPPRRCLCITDASVTQCSQAQFGDFA